MNEAKFEFRGTGAELFKGLIKGWLLVGVTLGIYLPWFIVGMIKLLTSKTSIRVGDDELRLEYTATGGELFKKAIVGYLLCGVTLGIYLPWFMVEMIQFQQSKLSAIRSSDGRAFRLDTGLTGGEVFKTFFVNYFLTGVTLGIYLPWAICNLQRFFLGKTAIKENDRIVATFVYEAQGGDLFKTFLVGYLLTMVTLGIYGFWFQVKLLSFFASKTAVRIDEHVYRGQFTGTGIDNFKVSLGGYLLTMITFGIYSFWYMADLLKFQLGNTKFVLSGGSGDQLPAPAPALQLNAGAAPAALPARAASVSSDPSDRRAAWARAFLTDDAPIGAPKQLQIAAPIPLPGAVSLEKRIVVLEKRADAAPAIIIAPLPDNIHETIVQGLSFPEYHEQTDRLSAQEPLLPS